MVKRQPGRPTEDEFIGAAERFCENDYPVWWESSYLAFAIASFGRIFTFAPAPTFYGDRTSRRSDIKTIKNERSAEGLVVGEERLSVFAQNQLARYRMSRRQ